MMTRSTSLLLALVLAAGCTRSKEERSSQIGRSNPPPDEALTPASRTIPDPTVEQPLEGEDDEDAASSAPAANPAPTATEPSPEATASPEAAPTRTPDVIYVPTPQPVVDKMLELAQVRKDDLVYDLGCGDGRIVVTAAKRYGARAVGFDIDPARVLEARANVRENNVQDLVTIEQKDIFTVDLSPATVVTLYLLPSLNNRLVPQLENLSAGARVVSHDYDISGVIPTRSLEIQPSGESREHSIFFYTMPFKRERSVTR